MYKKIILSFISISLFLSSCSFEQDPLASFPKEIRNGKLPGDNRVLKPIPRGVIEVSSFPESPLVFHDEPSQIGIDVRLLQSFQAPYTVEVLNLDTLPGKSSFDNKKNQIHWVPNLSGLSSLFEYIPIRIRVNFADPRPLYVEHTIYVRAYRTLLGLKLENLIMSNFVAGSKKVAKVIMTVKDLDVNVNIGGKKAAIPRLMITQGALSNVDYLLPYLKALPRPYLRNWKDSSTWVIEAHFDLSKLKLNKDAKFYIGYEVFSSFGKSFGLKNLKIPIEKNIAGPSPVLPPVPAPSDKTKISKKKTSKNKKEVK